MLLDVCEELVAEARRAGAAAADAYAIQDELRAVQRLRGGRMLERRGRGVAATVRIWRGGELGTASSTDWPLDARRLVGQAAAAAHGARAGAPPPPEDVTGRRVFDLPDRVAPPGREALAALLAGEQALGVEYARMRSRRALASSAGVAVESEHERHSLWHWLDGPGGHMLDGICGSTAAGLDPAQLTRLGAELAGARGTARERPAAGHTAVLLRAPVAIPVLQTVAAVLSGTNVTDERSPLRRRVGSPIASAAVTLVDDPLRGDGACATPVDGEGRATARTVLIERGVLRGFLHSSETARRCGVAPNGCAVRPLVTARPRPGPTNLVLESGSQSVSELRRTMGIGVEAVSVVRPAGLAAGAGAFRVEAFAWRIAGGERAGALGPVVLELGLFELLRSIVAMSDAPLASFVAPGVILPDLLIDRMRLVPAGGR